jgi:hypothetical protein
MTPDESMSPIGDKKHNLFYNETLTFLENLNPRVYLKHWWLITNRKGFNLIHDGCFVVIIGKNHLPFRNKIEFYFSA